MCIQAKQCLPACDCTHKHLKPLTILINVLFTCLAMFHLAYLGVMFDSSSDSEQETGYSMFHTLDKWSKLGFSSHIVVAISYVFYWLIKWPQATVFSMQFRDSIGIQFAYKWSCTLSSCWQLTESQLLEIQAKRINHDLGLMWEGNGEVICWSIVKGALSHSPSIVLLRP